MPTWRLFIFWGLGFFIPRAFHPGFSGAYWRRRDDMKKLLVLLAIVMLSGFGCAGLPDNFVEKMPLDTGIRPLVYGKATWLKGVYGFQGMPFNWKPTFIRGAIACDDDGFYFILLDKNLNRYISTLNLPYKDIKTISVGKHGASRCLVLYGKVDVFTFQFEKGGMVDRLKTYEVASLIANKIGQDATEFDPAYQKEQKGKEAEKKE
jgi:hypothetical protein